MQSHESHEQKQGHIFTIGYGAKPIGTFLAILEQYRIEFVIDVRSSPYSKFRPEFSRDALKTSLAEHKIRYIFMGDQIGGRPNDDTCYDSDGKVDYSIVEKRPYFIAGIERIIQSQKLGYRVCLMCSEDKPENCHRSKLISRILESKGLKSVHIISEKRILSQAEVISLLQKGQTALFSDPLKSRKAYLR